ncbi:MAG: LysE family transporter [Deltaproteobacteria bacterium]|nr:LysE family transporter [Deltaproteobacteria bacterium]
MLLVPVIGFLFGFVGSMPVAGPVSILVLERGLSGRFRGGLYLAAGAAVAESVYAFLAFFGLAALLARYPAVVPLSQAGGAVILLCLGVALLRRRRSSEVAVAPRPATHGDAVLGFTITALNPTFIATWTAAVTTLYGTGLVPASTSLALPFSLSVCVGIVAWFAVLLSLVRRCGGRMSQRTVAIAVRVMGVMLLGIAVWFGAKFGLYLAR